MLAIILLSSGLTLAIVLVGRWYRRYRRTKQELFHIISEQLRQNRQLKKWLSGLTDFLSEQQQTALNEHFEQAWSLLKSAGQNYKRSRLTESHVCVNRATLCLHEVRKTLNKVYLSILDQVDKAWPGKVGLQPDGHWWTGGTGLLPDFDEPLVRIHSRTMTFNLIQERLLRNHGVEPYTVALICWYLPVGQEYKRPDSISCPPELEPDQEQTPSSEPVRFPENLDLNGVSVPVYYRRAGPSRLS